ncbi:hypothetical protein JG688_00016828 [Phytophthora aleatoria]|uniref:HTH CENPB-type domain-containing protein n=1 Tax=Phytophthora aleatoria TaxID=2496075 RepID=A0A8J5I3U0_9STRA|nr:hypothetical protein JG688_00016828 [Phytophthora aleatoria]
MYKWSNQARHIHDVCGLHKNLRNLGEATVLSEDAEVDIVSWVNTLREDGPPVSRLMLQLEAKEIAAETYRRSKFSASPTWIKLFLRRHKLSLRSRTPQGQTIPQDAQEVVR